LADIQRVFISYSRRDQELVFRLVNDLASQGIGAWIDQRDIKPGQIWDDSLNRAIDRCPYLLLALSPASVVSPYVHDEVSRAKAQDHRLFSALIEDCEIPPEFYATRMIDFRERYPQAVIDLARALQAGGYPLQVPIGTAAEVKAHSSPHPPGMYNRPIYDPDHAYRVVSLRLPPDLRGSLTPENLDAINQLDETYYRQEYQSNQSITDFVRQRAREQGFDLSAEFIHQVLEARDLYYRLAGILQD
jgi:hypothetical protein